VPLSGPAIFYTILGFIIWNNWNLVFVLIVYVLVSTSNIRLIQEPFLVKTQSFVATKIGLQEEKSFTE